MLKKLVVGALATGIVLSGGAGVFAAEDTTIKSSTVKISETRELGSSAAQAAVRIYNGNVEFYVNGLESTFEQPKYYRVVWSTEFAGKYGPSQSSILASALAPAKGYGYSNSVRQDVPLWQISNKVSKGKTVYAYVQLNSTSGEWWPAGSATVQ
ncbi:hypothetical protein D0U04_22585 [Bacillus clarus]|uniref:DUF5065 domain-containing protein n=1 Tax=Bacillus clarus TaxID=2338372 RepID=A0A090YBK6_9BACI|nr:hypothetical protein [Bacillus clarus]KFM95546.1 hypothetical protein DJ93_5515 [Bacillus clarus]RFT64350.1 hypothetical protein D0U04_22585 [Bacillus clarus]